MPTREGVTVTHAIIVFIGLGLLLLTLPLALEMLCLTIAAALPWPPPLRAAGDRLRLHVIVPAHNEEQLIGPCVHSLISTSPANVQVFVVAHNCTDQTATRAAEAGANVLVLDDTVGGKGTALNYAFRHAQEQKADAVLVIDADSTVSSTLTAQVCATLAGGADALQCRYQVGNALASARTRLVALAFSGMNVVRPRGRHRLGLSCGIFGNGFALSISTLHQVPYVANSVVEDLEYHLHLLRANRRVIFLDSATVFGEMPTSGSGSATQRARWEGGRILMRREWTRPLIAQVLRGRLRMLEPLLDILALPLATEAGLLVVAVAIPLTRLRVYAGAGLLAMGAYVLLSALLGPEPASTLRAVASVPGYMLWKLWLYPRTRLAARRDAAWVRTRRNQPAGQTPPEPK